MWLDLQVTSLSLLEPDYLPPPGRRRRSPVFQAAFLAFTGTAAKVAGRVAKAGLKFLKLDPDIGTSRNSSTVEAKVYVFDDLERCLAPINKVLGYINQFVEHGDAKVIVLANEKEIGSDEDYTRRHKRPVPEPIPN
jgi:hypothetical protein